MWELLVLRSMFHHFRCSWVEHPSGLILVGYLQKTSGITFRDLNISHLWQRTKIFKSTIGRGYLRFLWFQGMPLDTLFQKLRFSISMSNVQSFVVFGWRWMEMQITKKTWREVIPVKSWETGKPVWQSYLGVQDMPKGKEFQTNRSHFFLCV